MRGGIEERSDRSGFGDDGGHEKLEHALGGCSCPSVGRCPLLISRRWLVICVTFAVSLG